MKTIGSIGLGAMGGSYAKFLIEDNYTVYGVDPDTQNAEIFISLGGILVNNISELLDKSNVIILSLPTIPIFKEVINRLILLRQLKPCKQEHLFHKRLPCNLFGHIHQKKQFGK